MTNDTFSHTLSYYSQNANEFYSSTIHVDMQELYDFFEKYLQPGSKILDVGCGSGRDSLYFRQKGYMTTPLEPCPELALLATKLTGLDVLEKRIEDIEFQNEFDGIWACASLLHIPFSEMKEVIIKLHKALKPQGILFISLKMGNFEGIRNGRYFCDYTLDKIKNLNLPQYPLLILDTLITEDKRPDRKSEHWLSMVVRKG